MGYILAFLRWLQWKQAIVRCRAASRAERATCLLLWGHWGKHKYTPARRFWLQYRP